MTYTDDAGVTMTAQTLTEGRVLVTTTTPEGFVLSYSCTAAEWIARLLSR